MKFYLGTHMPHWLTLVDFPLFVSRTRLTRYRNLPRARASWALDSGGFTQLDQTGTWSVSARDYARDVRRYRDEIGSLDWAAPMDWMCEPRVRARTGLTVQEHQRRTVDNYLELRALADEVPWVPVLQGWHLADYLEHVDAYRRSGVDLKAEPLVGLGSVCRRQGTAEIGLIVETLAALGLRLHGFGVKRLGLASYSSDLTSADSMAWSLRGRNVRPCTHGDARTEANCLAFATEWRAETLGMAT